MQQQQFDVVEQYTCTDSTGEALLSNDLRSGLQTEHPGFKPWPGSLHCVLGQDITLIVPLPTGKFSAGGNPPTGLASNPGGSRITPRVT